MHMDLFGSVVRKVLKEEFEKGGFYVFHGTKNTAEEGIASKGFERFFTATNGGNLYGPGVYTTYKLSNAGQNARGAYGQIMFKLRVKSLRNFVIYDEDIAKRVYGNPSVDYQLQKILTPEQYNKMRNSSYYDYNKIINSRKDDKSSNCALYLCGYLEHIDREAGYQINGFIFKGNHDGYVCFLRDFKNAYPVQISRDCGKTWEEFKGKETLKKYGIDDVDLKWQLGKHNYQLMQELDEVPYFFINGFAKVRKGDKYNFLYRKKPLKEGVISPVWFDYAPDTFTNKGTALVEIDGDKFILRLDTSTNKFYVYYDDGTYLCKLDVFDRILPRLSNQSRETEQPDNSEYQPQEGDEDDNF